MVVLVHANVARYKELRGLERIWMEVASVLVNAMMGKVLMVSVLPLAYGIVHVLLNEVAF